MNSFELKLDNTTYRCSGSQYGQQNQNWEIRADMEGLRVNITIPIETKYTRLQAMAFVERLHAGLQAAKTEQKPSVEYTS